MNENRAVPELSLGTTDPGGSSLARPGRDTTFVLVSFPIALVSFTVLSTGLSLAAGLLVTVIGIPVAVGTLGAASGFAALERKRLAGRGTPLAYVRPPARRQQGLRGMVSLLADRGRWAEVVHGIGVLAVSVVTWSIVVTWWAGALGGLTYWFWSRFLPQPDPGTTNTLPQLLHLPISDSFFNLAIGAIFAATLVPVVRGCVRLHVAWAAALLSGSSRRALEERVEDLTERRAAAASAEAQAPRRFERDLRDGPQQRLVRRRPSRTPPTTWSARH